MVKEGISFLTLGITHDEAIYIRNRYMCAVLKWDNDFHRVNFHLVKFGDFILLYSDQFFDNINIHFIVSLIELDHIIRNWRCFLFKVKAQRLSIWSKNSKSLSQNSDKIGLIELIIKRFISQSICGPITVDKVTSITYIILIMDSFQNLTKFNHKLNC